MRRRVRMNGLCPKAHTGHVIPRPCVPPARAMTTSAAGTWTAAREGEMT